ncbi:MAG TPA: biopolymer transporter ExbD [Candidatus Krumholzibacteria bacterium]|nr:biopolymer transporter ExbD [Candidatus Krumholzibacteria bacterium]
MEFRNSKRKSRSVFVNVTSFIDVLFVLLLFFMVSTTFVNQPAMSLDLPKAVHTQGTRQPAIIVYVDQHGNVHLNDEPVDDALLDTALRSRLATSEDKAVVLKADSRVSHGTVVHVLDIIKGAGVQKLTIATQPTS